MLRHITSRHCLNTAVQTTLGPGDLSQPRIRSSVSLLFKEADTKNYITSPRKGSHLQNCVEIEGRPLRLHGSQGSASEDTAVELAFEVECRLGGNETKGVQAGTRGHTEAQVASLSVFHWR